MRAIWIAAAGSLGALGRYGLEGLVSNRVRGAFPWGTWMVNVTGSFVLGLVFTLMTERFLPHPNLRAAVTIGFLGAYTTFSTFSLETVRLFEDGAVMLGVANAVASVGAGIAAVYAGIWLGRAL